MPPDPHRFPDDPAVLYLMLQGFPHIPVFFVVEPHLDTESQPVELLIPEPQACGIVLPLHGGIDHQLFKVDGLPFPEQDVFHRFPYGAGNLLCRQGINVPFPPFLLYGDPAVELVFGQAVFHTEGRKFFFLPFPFPV